MAAISSLLNFAGIPASLRSTASASVVQPQLRNVQLCQPVPGTSVALRAAALVQSHALNQRTHTLGFDCVEAPVAVSGPISPEGEVHYTATVSWRGQPQNVDLVFDEAFAQNLRQRGIQVDVEKAEFIKPNGARAPIFVGNGWESTLGVLSVLPGDAILAAQPACVTDCRITFDRGLPDGTADFRVSPLRWRSDVNVYSDSQKPASKLSFQPILFSKLVEKPLASNVKLVGVSADSLARVEESVRDVLGKSLASGVARDKLLATPLEIVAVPAGQHWSTMPQCAPLRADLLSTRNSELSQNIVEGIFTTVSIEQADGKRQIKHFAFLPEDDIITQRHELIHALENLFLNDEALSRVDEAYARAVPNNGPFARSYGSQRGEYLSTWGELFEGKFGKAGIDWLKEKEPDVYNVLSEATGRRP